MARSRHRGVYDSSGSWVPFLGGPIFEHGDARRPRINRSENGENPATEVGSAPTQYPVIRHRYAVDGTEHTDSNYMSGSDRPSVPGSTPRRPLRVRNRGRGDAHYERSGSSNPSIKKETAIPLRPHGVRTRGASVLTHDVGSTIDRAPPRKWMVFLGAREATRDVMSRSTGARGDRNRRSVLSRPSGSASGGFAGVPRRVSTG